ncbi:MAG: hypothetical protein M1480_09395 [Bacteroidetes bacterium]|nr:hypothetical protein [Bacteroidota bacterium]
MEELLPDIIINTDCDSKSFIKRLYNIVRRESHLYKSVYEKDSIIPDTDYLEIMPIEQNGNQDIIAQIFSVSDKENIVQVEIKAPTWKLQPVTYDLYVEEAKRILNPLINDYNKNYCVRRRLSIQSKDSLEKKLPRLANDLFKIFVHATNKNMLHPLDWKRFYIFIRHCYSKKVNLYPDELLRLLIANGFEKRKAEYLSDIFSHGIKILGAY